MPSAASTHSEEAFGGWGRRDRPRVCDRLQAPWSRGLIVEMMPQILTGTDSEIGKTLGRILKKQGMEIMLNTTVGAVEKQGDSRSRARSTAMGTAGKEETREFDMVLVAVGRRPVTDNLGLEAAGLNTDDRGFIATDRQQRTRVPNIFAIGDVTGAALARASRDEAGRDCRRGDLRRQVRGLRSRRGPNCIYLIPKSPPSGSPRRKRRPPAMRCASESSRWARAAAPER